MSTTRGGSRAKPPQRLPSTWSEPGITDPTMNDTNGYAVFFFPQALEALGDAIKPYLQDSPAGPHVLCREIDTGGARRGSWRQGLAAAGRRGQLVRMAPGARGRMIVSSQSEGNFASGPRDQFEPTIVAPKEKERRMPRSATPAPATPARRILPAA